MSSPRKEKIQVERLALEGDGVGRILTNGPESQKVAFVAYSLPGEVVEARLMFDKKNHSRWIPTNIISPAATRVKPRCPYHFEPGKSPACGGCDFQHISPVFQKKVKSELLKETLVRLGGVADPKINPILSGHNDWRYRNKIQVPFGIRRNKLVSGFYAPGSHDIVEFEDCVIQPDLSVQIFQAVKKMAISGKWPPYDEDRHRGWLRHILIRTNEAGQALVALVVTTDRFPVQKHFISEIRKLFPSITSLHLNIQPGRTHAILGYRWIKLWGSDHLEETMHGFKLAYSPGSFFQVNTKAAEALYGEALRQLDPKETQVALDIYSGVGALTFMAARKTKFAIGIEEAPSSIRDANWNMKLNQIQNVKFVQGAAERVLQEPEKLWGEYLKQQDLVVMVDPPRSGCMPEVLSALVKLRPRRIVYVSCNPATLARDVKILAPSYKFIEATPVDLFPQTSHVEAVVRLDKN